MRIPFRALFAAGAFACLTPIVARSQTDTALKLSTTVPQAASEFKAGVVDWENFSFDAAASHFQSALKSDPNLGLARTMYGFIGGQITGELTQPQALAEADRGVADAASHGTTNELLLATAYREALRGNNRAAAALFRAASLLMPRDRIIALNGIPNATGASGIPMLHEFIAKNPDYPLSYNTLAYALWGQGDRAGAEQAAKRQVELNANAPNPHDTYAEILQWNGKFPEAIAEYRLASMTAPKFPEAYAGLAEVEALQGHYDQARAYLNQAMANAWTPQQRLNYMRQIAGTYALQGNAPDAYAKQLEAVAAEAKAQQNQRASAIATAQSAAIYATAGNASAAHQAIGAAKAVNADVPWQVNYYAAMSHGLMKHWTPANQELAALKAKQAGDQAVSDDMVAAVDAFLATQQGRPAEALKMLTTADTTNFLVMSRMAEAHAALGHTAEAARWNKKITSNYQLNLA
ncbi:MAG: tetratricopeptide repeat protein, partial [Gemmatimonadales bacterium]